MGSRDRKTKWYAEQLALDASSEYIPVISTVVTGNFVKQKSNGTIEDAGVNAASIVGSEEALVLAYLGV